MSPSAATRDPERQVRILGVGALVAAVGYLVWRGPLRAITDSEDLAVGYAAARAWWLGLDPYAVSPLKSVLLDAQGGILATGDLLDGLRNVYPPTTLPMFLPIAIGAWPVAWPLMLALNLGASIAIVIGLVRLMGWRLGSTPSIWLAALVLALGPLHLTMALGQTAILATATLVGAIVLDRVGRPGPAGILYGLTAAIKIQIGLPFIAYLVWRRRWAGLAVAGIVLAGLTGLSAARMTLAGVPWFDSWMTNLAILSGPGGVNDPSQQNPDRYSLINLQYLIESVVADARLSTVLTFVLVGAAAGLTVWFIRGRQPGHELLGLSIVAVLGLLVVYHRYYDAVVLAIPIGWAIGALGTARRFQGAVVLLLSLDFVLPVLGLVRTIEARELLPQALLGSAAWELVVVPSHVWALVLMAAVLLTAAARSRREPSVTPAS